MRVLVALGMVALYGGCTTKVVEYEEEPAAGGGGSGGDEEEPAAGGGSSGEDEQEPAAGSGGGYLKNMVSLLIEILRHNEFGKCAENKASRYTHLAILYGAIFTLLAAGLGAVYHLAGVEAPYVLSSPVKIAGNLGGLLLIVGCILVIVRRLSANDKLGRTGYFDWFLIWMLFLTTVTGFATEVIRLYELAAATYWLYLVHLWLMFVFFVYLPFSKGAHMIYRTVALAYARQIGRVEG